MSKHKLALICISSFIAVLIVFSVFSLSKTILGIFRLQIEVYEINSYADSGNYEEALKFVDELLVKQPDRAVLNSQKGLILTKLGEYEEAIAVLDTALKLNPNDNNAMTSLSRAYNALGKYELALEYSNRALAIRPDSSDALVNKGNALTGLEKYDEAIQAYNNALKIDPEYWNAYYKRGIAYYYLGNNENAIEDLTKYTAYNEKSTNGYLYLAQAYYYEGMYDKSVGASDAALKLNPENTDALFYKGQALSWNGDYDEAINNFNAVIKEEPKYTDAYLYEGITFYFMGKYNDALTYYDKAIKLEPDYSTPYVWKAKAYVKSGRYKTALELCDKALSIDAGDSNAYVVKARVSRFQGNPDQALNLAGKAIELDNGDEDAYVEKAADLFDEGSYSETADFVESALKKFPDNYDLLWYGGDSCSYMGRHERAIELYEKTWAKDTKNEDVALSLGWEYYYQQEYNKASQFADRVLEMNKKNNSALELKDKLKETSLPEAQRIVNFISSNYLYLNSVKDFQSKAKTFESKNNISISDIREFLNSITADNDKFTYLISGQDYDSISREDSDTHIFSKDLSNIVHYIAFDSFTSNIGSEFKKDINGLGNTEKRILVIDLRNNPGGLTDSANEILDLLLGKCTTITLQDRNGITSKYTSDPNIKRFKKIILFVNENSASSSEILALSLKKHLGNVVVIGHPTFGKGVGQLTFENKEKRYIIYLTNFYWKVENQSIAGSRITPDIIIKGAYDSDYFDEMQKLVSNNIK